MTAEPDRQPILVIDDSDANRYALRRYLERACFTVWEAATGSDGMETALRQPALLLLDIKLPDANGYDLCRRLRADSRTATIPILLISSALKSSGDKARGLNAGADGYLAGPVDPEELVAHVRLLLRLRASQSALHEANARLRRLNTELEQAHEELREHARDLERRVQERTAELVETNAKLRAEIAERRAVEESRAALLRQLIGAEEEERRRIARELHDEMGQHVTALSLGLKTLKDAAAESREVARLTPALEQMTDQIGQEIHRLALQLRPTALDDLGLAATLKNYVQAWGRRARIEADFQSANYPSAGVAREVESTFYRTVQEGLNNVAKHAAATRVSVVLEHTENQVQVIIEDDGRGFDSDEALRSPEWSNRLGLRGMRERLAMLGGSLQIESSRGSGTTLFARVPAPSVR